MAETYAQAIAKARARYAEAMDGAAADALVIAEQHDKPLAVVCRGIAPDEAEALRKRASRLKAKGGAAQAQAAGRARASAQRHARVVLKDPEQAAKVIASLPPAALDAVYHEARLARAGEDRTPATRKAAHAAASNAVAPMKRATDRTQQGLILQALEEAHDDLSRLLDEGGRMTPQGIERGKKLTNDIANLLLDAEFALEEVGS